MTFALDGAQQFSSGQGHLHHVYEENVKGTTAICGKFVAFWVEFGDQLNSRILRKNLVGEWVLFEDSFTLGAFFFSGVCGYIAECVYKYAVMYAHPCTVTTQFAVTV